MSNWLDEYMAKLSPEDQETFKEFLRDENNYVVEDFSELFALLEQIVEQKKS